LSKYIAGKNADACEHGQSTAMSREFSASVADAENQLMPMEKLLNVFAIAGHHDGKTLLFFHCNFYETHA
jgi:hypothetical protein